MEDQQVLGRVIEIVSNKTLDVFLKDRVFNPLDMKDTAFYVDESKWYRLLSLLKKQLQLISIRNKPNFSLVGMDLFLP